MTFVTVDVCIDTTVDVDLSYISTDELLNELAQRGEDHSNMDDVNELVEKLYHKVCLKQNYYEEIRDLIWMTVGRTV